MLAKLFLELTEFAFFRRLVWKPIYQFLAKRFANPDWHFMNYGYSPDDGNAQLSLVDTDEINRYPIQLYHDLATKTEIENKDVLEVGSGRGGGAHFIMRYLKPRTMTGMDIASNAVDFCNEQHKTPGLKYVTGNAESMPFADNSFDVVINVESSHAYGSVPQFLLEAKRVLRPGGIFLCTDMRDRDRIDMLEQQMKDSGMELLQSINISGNVVKAIEMEDAIKKDRIAGQIPKKFRAAFEEFAGVKGSAIHEGLKNGNLVYKEFILRK